MVGVAVGSWLVLQVATLKRQLQATHQIHHLLSLGTMLKGWLRHSVQQLVSRWARAAGHFDLQHHGAVLAQQHARIEQLDQELAAAAKVMQDAHMRQVPEPRV